jgi:hypothetical protein
MRLQLYSFLYMGQISCTLFHLTPLSLQAPFHRHIILSWLQQYVGICTFLLFSSVYGKLYSKHPNCYVFQLLET